MHFAIGVVVKCLIDLPHRFIAGKYRTRCPSGGSEHLRTQRLIAEIDIQENFRVNYLNQEQTNQNRQTSPVIFV
tara:strand:- start:1743 stop:1964 length:222 start_codon:yes stop_codon:yes gene_type:complete